PELPSRSLAAWDRNLTLGTEQAPVISELRRTAAKNLRTYRTINAIGATVSQAEISRLRLDPAVGAVVPDLVIHASPSTEREQPVVPRVRRALPTTGTPSAICPSDPSQPLLEPEALQLTNATTTPFDGAGVKVAFIADGVDVNNPDFIRADGSHVF